MTAFPEGRMSFDDWLLLIHIVAAAIWLGGALVLYLLSRASVQSGEESRMIRQYEWVGPRTGGPMSLVIVATGAWMVLRNEAWSLGDLWIILGLAAFAVLTYIGLGIHLPNYKRIHAAEEDGDTDRVKRLARRGFALAGWEVVILVVLFGVMVFKP